MGTASNVIVGLANLYLAPANTAAPAIVSSTGICTPSGAWIPSGFTESGVVLNVDHKTDSIMVDEQSTPVAVIDDSTNVTIDITFAEDTIQNQLNAYGGGVISTIAPATGIAGQTVLTLADALITLALCFVATNAAGFSRVLYIPNVVSAGKVKTTYQRKKAPRTYPATFTAICALNQITVTDVTATHA